MGFISLFLLLGGKELLSRESLRVSLQLSGLLRPQGIFFPFSLEPHVDGKFMGKALSGLSGW